MSDPNTTPTDDRVRAIIAGVLERMPGEIRPELHLVEDLGADSLDRIEIWMAIEDAFGIGVTDDDAERLRTVADAVRLVEERCGAGNPR